MNSTTGHYRDTEKPMIHSHVPKYYYLREKLRAEIPNWPTNHQIPSEAELCEAYHVSRTTVRKALDYLIYEGLLYRVQGKGTYVSPAKVMGRFIQSTAGFWNDVRNQGLNLRTNVLEHSVKLADSYVAKALSLPKGERVFSLVRVRYIEDDPVMITAAYVPYRLCSGIETENFTNQSFYQTLHEKYNAIIDHGMQYVEARPCSVDEAKYLKIEPDTPLLVTTGTMYDRNDMPVEFNVAKSRWDRLRCEVRIEAGPG